MRKILCGLLLSLLLTLPARATQLSLDVIGSLAPLATDTGDAIFTASARAPMTLIVGYTSVNAASVTVSVEVSMDGTNWAVPGIDATTPSTGLVQSINGNGNFIVIPIALVAEQGGASATNDLPGHLGPWMRVKVLNSSAVTAITNLRTAVYSN